MTQLLDGRLETRYIVSIDLADAILKEVGGKKEEYNCRTIYIVNGKTPLRLREYRGNGNWFLECKQRSKKRVIKRRWELGRISRIEKIPAITEVRYHREARQIGEFRVTKDTDLRTADKRLRKHLCILELKGDFPVSITSLLPPEKTSFSKRKWAVT